MTTILYASLLTFGLIFLSINVIKGRRFHKVALGNGEQQDMLARVRAQGNFAEYSIFFIVLLFLNETSGMPIFLVHIFGIIFLCGRALHAYSLLKDETYVDGQLAKNPTYRIAGMMITFSTLGILGLSSLILYFTQ
jgi:uncharacterized membrane protein YecN with MAPEG domain